jgi:Na+(H+)/acetate symporter ActP
MVRPAWQHNQLVVLVVVVAVLLCMLFMPGMAIFALTGVATAALLLAGALVQVVAVAGPTLQSVTSALGAVARDGPRHNRLSPLRL